MQCSNVFMHVHVHRTPTIYYSFNHVVALTFKSVSYIFMYWLIGTEHWFILLHDNHLFYNVIERITWTSIFSIRTTWNTFLFRNCTALTVSALASLDKIATYFKQTEEWIFCDKNLIKKPEKNYRLFWLKSINKHPNEIK